MKKTKTLEFGGGGDPLDRVNEAELARIFNKDIKPLPSNPTLPKAASSSQPTENK